MSGGLAAGHSPRADDRRRNGLTADDRRLARRTAVVDAGLELFGTQGYAATSVNDICRAASISTRTFYLEFCTREEVLWALGDDIVDDAYQATVEATYEPGDDDTRREATARVSALAHSLLDDPRRTRVAFVEVLGLSIENEARRWHAHHQFAAFFAAWLGVECDEGRFETRQDELLAVSMVGTMSEVLSDWYMRTDKVPIDELVESIVDVMMTFRRSVSPRV